MDALRIEGGVPLEGTVPISGAKNAALPIMVASLLTTGELAMEGAPDVGDIDTLAELLRALGVEVRRGPAPGAVSARAGSLASTRADYGLVRRMRASVLVLGPLLARAGEAEVSLPGGCAIGSRPVDMHVAALERLGADVSLEGGYLRARAPSGLRGGRVRLPFPSVGATESALMAAVLARGETEISGAALEPEVEDLAGCLAAMGARVEGAGTATLRVQGVDSLSGARWRVAPDRLEAGTYAAFAAATRGRLTLEGARADHLEAFLGARRAAGVSARAAPGGVEVDARGARLEAVDVATAPHPGFPTDLQAQFMAVMLTAEGASRITENIFENRFMHVPEMARLGASVRARGGAAEVRGPSRLRGAQMTATDIRASAGLVAAALAAEGESLIRRLYHLDRGYGDLEGKLAAVGARAERVPDPEGGGGGPGEGGGPSEGSGPSDEGGPPGAPGGA